HFRVPHPATSATASPGADERRAGGADPLDVAEAVAAGAAGAVGRGDRAVIAAGPEHDLADAQEVSGFADGEDLVTGEEVELVDGGERFGQGEPAASVGGHVVGDHVVLGEAGDDLVGE